MGKNSQSSQVHIMNIWRYILVFRSFIWCIVIWLWKGEERRAEEGREQWREEGRWGKREERRGREGRGGNRREGEGEEILSMDMWHSAFLPAMYANVYFPSTSSNFWIFDRWEIEPHCNFSLNFSYDDCSRFS